MRSCPRSSPTLPQSCVSPPRSSTRNNIHSITNQLKKSDARKIESFCQKYVCAFDKGERAERAKLEKAYQPTRLCGALCHQQEREECLFAQRKTSMHRSTFCPWMLPMYPSPSSNWRSISQSATKYTGLDLTLCIRDKKVERGVS